MQNGGRSVCGSIANESKFINKMIYHSLEAQTNTCPAVGQTKTSDQYSVDQS